MHSLFSAGRIEIDLPTSDELLVPETSSNGSGSSVQTRFETD